MLKSGRPPAVILVVLVSSLALTGVLAEWAHLGRDVPAATQGMPPTHRPEGKPDQPEPTAMANLSIQVRYADGEVVPWARVEVWDGGPSTSEGRRLLNASNEDSTYSILLTKGRTYLVLAWGDGDLGYLGQREVPLGGDSTFRFVVPSRPKPIPTGRATLSIHVRYTDGTVVALGRVQVWEGVPGAQGSPGLLEASNIDSTYSIALQTPRRYYVRAWGDSASGYLGEMAVNLTSNRTVTFIDPTNPYPLSPRVLAFFYAWYGNLVADRRWIHWDEAGRRPPDDIASAFYPTLGPYSSVDLATLKQHMQWIRESGAGVLIYSWWGNNTTTDQRLPAVLDQAARFGLRVSIHLEPGAYHTSPAAVVQAAVDLRARLGSHPAFLTRFYIFLATQFPLDQWRAALTSPHPTLLAQVMDSRWMDVFDGLFQYDGSVNLSTGAWATLAAQARTLCKLFVPNVAPGYDESRAAGGRTFLTVGRENGARYDRLWAAALASGVDYVAITTFNEWHEGTQIEPAQPRAIPGFTYGNYGGFGPIYYIERTLHWTRTFIATAGPPIPSSALLAILVPTMGPRWPCLSARGDRKGQNEPLPCHLSREIGMPFDPKRFIEEKVEEIRRIVLGKAIVAVSGGVDSTTVAVLASRALGPGVLAVYVDTGFMRKGERAQVETTLSELGVPHKVVDASQAFFAALEGITDPEIKRLAIGRKFVEVFEAEARALGAEHLVQGTIAPDWIESGGQTRDRIKTHHNVAGLPATMKLKLVEPLRELYKDEVRKVARTLRVRVAERQPFPGPGLAVRCLGEVTPAKVEVVREACAIVEEEIENAAREGGVAIPWQYFAVLLPIRSVGVKGDVRAYGYTVVVRSVESTDGMTASFSPLPLGVLERISTRITNEIPGVNRVVYDITHKPPATIEWE